MQPVPSRIALAGSILVLGSVSTVSAVNLQASPTPLKQNPDTTRALSPLGTHPVHPAGPADVPSAHPELPRDTESDARSSTGSSVRTKDLIDLATEPLSKDVITVPVREVTRPALRPVKQLTRTAVTKSATHAVRKSTRTVRKTVRKTVKNTPHKVVDETIDRYRFKRSKKIGNFGRAIARDAAKDMAERMGGRIARQAVDSYFTASSSGWAKSFAGEYVGRHRAD